MENLTDHENIVSLIKKIMADEYIRGCKEGICLAEKAMGYLTIQPQREWAKRISMWVEEDVKKFKIKHGI